MPLPPTFTFPAAADFHVHLRDGAMAAAVVPTIRQGGVSTVYVMPNLTPPITTVEMALAYKERLEAVQAATSPQAAPVEFLMTLYLHESITPDVVRAAKKAGIAGIKSYPAGVTTNSAAGVVSYEPFYPVFAAMEEEGLVLNLHGEVPSAKDITILNAEASFLPVLAGLHKRFPRLRIVLEHCTTADAVEAVKACGDTVVGTITAHHLFLTIDGWANDVFCYCKPVAKLPTDRHALLNALVKSKDFGGKFFLGTDSAPHPLEAKKGKGQTAAGVFTQPYACQYVLSALEEGIERGDIKEEDVTQDVLEGFLGKFGRKFYGVEEPTGQKIKLTKGTDDVIVDAIRGECIEVVPFRKGQKTWSLEWI